MYLFKVRTQQLASIIILLLIVVMHFTTLSNLFLPDFLDVDSVQYGQLQTAITTLIILPIMTVLAHLFHYLMIKNAKNALIIHVSPNLIDIESLSLGEKWQVRGAYSDDTRVIVDPENLTKVLSDFFLARVEPKAWLTPRPLVVLMLNPRHSSVELDAIRRCIMEAGAVSVALCENINSLCQIRECLLNTPVNRALDDVIVIGSNS